MHRVNTLVSVLLVASLLGGCAAGFDLQGHRGARGLMPENTLPAFAKALEIGVTTLELDSNITRDGIVVISHDSVLNPDLARLSDGKWLETPVNNGPSIFSMTFEELQHYDVGRIKSHRENGRRFIDGCFQPFPIRKARQI